MNTIKSIINYNASHRNKIYLKRKYSIPTGHRGDGYSNHLYTRKWYVASQYNC